MSLSTFTRRQEYNSENKKGDKIYLCGGRKKNSNGISTLYANVFVYDIATNNWVEKKALPYALSAGTGIMDDAKNMLLFGGRKRYRCYRATTLALFRV